MTRRQNAGNAVKAILGMMALSIWPICIYLEEASNHDWSVWYNEAHSWDRAARVERTGLAAGRVPDEGHASANPLGGLE